MALRHDLSISASVSGAQSVENLYNNLAGVVVAATAIPIAISYGTKGMLSSLVSVNSFTTGIRDQAVVLGRGQKELLSFSGLLQTIGLSATESASSIASFTKNISNALYGIGEARRPLSELGILYPQDRDLSDIFLEVADKIKDRPLAYKQYVLEALGLPVRSSIASAYNVERLAEFSNKLKEVNKLTQELLLKNADVTFNYRAQFEITKAIMRNIGASLFEVTGTLAKYIEINNKISSSFQGSTSGALSGTFKGVAEGFGWITTALHSVVVSVLYFINSTDELIKRVFGLNDAFSGLIGVLVSVAVVLGIIGAIGFFLGRFLFPLLSVLRVLVPFILALLPKIRNMISSLVSYITSKTRSLFKSKWVEKYTLKDRKVFKPETIITKTPKKQRQYYKVRKYIRSPKGSKGAKRKYRYVTKYRYETKYQTNKGRIFVEDGVIKVPTKLGLYIKTLQRKIGELNTYIEKIRVPRGKANLALLASVVVTDVIKQILNNISANEIPIDFKKTPGYARARAVGYSGVSDNRVITNNITVNGAQSPQETADLVGDKIYGIFGGTSTTSYNRLSTQ